MKKWIAGLLSLIMLLGVCSAALAEDPEVMEIRWETYRELVEQSGMEGSYLLLDETDVAVWIADSLTLVYIEDDEEEEEETAEETETGDAADPEEEEDEFEDIEENILAQFGAADESSLIEVALWEFEEGTETMEDLIPALAEEFGEEELLRVNVNGLDGVYLEDEEAVIGTLLVMFEPGRLLKVTFFPLGDDLFNATCRLFIASIQKVEVLEETD